MSSGPRTHTDVASPPTCKFLHVLRPRRLLRDDEVVAESGLEESRRRLAPSTSGPVAVGGLGYPAPLLAQQRPLP
jgi:hypothetical protein